jgi:error-prone DNA polymerase
MAVRDMAKALGHSPGQQDAFSKQLDGWTPLATQMRDINSGVKGIEHVIPADVVDLAGQLQDHPRHLSIHSGGMVICDRPVGEVCPVEWARMANRSVLQWDKDDCAAIGLVKFDLLGLGTSYESTKESRSISHSSIWRSRRSTRCSDEPIPLVFSRWSPARRWQPFRV